MPFGHFQYQALTEPVSTQAEIVTEAKWHQPWSEPVRFKISGQLAVALAASGAFFLLHPGNETISPDKWLRWWSEPVRFRGYAQQTKPGLWAAAQPFFTTSPQPFVSFSWYAALGGPAPPPKPGLAARLQQTLAQPVRLLPTASISGTMSATETPDTALFGGLQFAPPVAAEIGIIVRP